MQFPITRESLRSFNRENAIAEKERQLRYDLYMTIIKKICNDVEQTLLNSKTPVTQYVWRDISIIGYLDHFTKNRNADIIKTPNIGDLIKTHNIQRAIMSMDIRVPDKEKDETLNTYLPVFIHLLKETFINCDIIVDPLKTYLIIDWS
jgi:hypothetical protein